MSVIKLVAGTWTPNSARVLVPLSILAFLLFSVVPSDPPTKQPTTSTLDGDYDYIPFHHEQRPSPHRAGHQPDPG